MKTNIILIGMPGAGKSTIGPELSRKMGLSFYDTDDFVAEAAGMKLSEYAAKYGSGCFLDLQERVILGLRLENSVIATGGSVGASPVLMNFLKKDGYAVYLKADFALIEKRLAPGRALARDKGKSLKELFDERSHRYEEHSDFTIECTDREVESIVNEIIAKINK